jgi:hypothetical protein
LRFFHSIFSNDTSAGNYPESLIKKAVERAVDGTDPWIRAVSGYKKKLRPAVVRAINYVVALVDDMAPPIVVEHDIYGRDPKLRTFFISNNDMQKILSSDKNLTDFQHGQTVALPRIFALLAMEKQEKILLGSEMSGDIIQHDVAHVAVSFEGHRLLDLATDEIDTRRQLKRRAFDHLLKRALGRIAIVKTERGKLERHRTLLHSKLDLLQRGGWGFDKTSTVENLDVDGLEELLSRIETELLKLGGDDRMLEVYLGIVIEVLARPEEHLWARKETLIVDRMGIKRSKADSDLPEVTIDIISNDDRQNFVVSLIALPSDFHEKQTIQPRQSS